jgi:hypothetical protein
LADDYRLNLITVCKDICGVQAQLMSAAELQLWARNHQCTRAEVHAELWQSRALVKTSLMRQTLHLIPAEDFAIYIAALKRSRTAALQRNMSKYAGVSQNDVAALNDLIVEALHAGPMTQPELLHRIKPQAGKRVRKWAEIAWSIQIFRAALVEGLICYGPEAGRKPTFVRVDRWLPNQKPVAENDAQQILLRRYLRAFAPAAPLDFSRWSGLQMKAAKSVWESLASELLEVQVAGKSAFVLRADFDELANFDLAEPVLRLLPAFDPFLLGHADKHHLVGAAHYKRVYRNQGWISPVILLNGRIVGVWFQRRQGRRLVLEIEPFEIFPKKIRRELEKEAAGLEIFLNTSLEIHFG